MHHNTASASFATSVLNVAPIAAQATATPQGQPVSIAVLANDSDANGGVLMVLSASGAYGSGGRAGGFVTTPAAGFSGSDSFTYTVTDGQGGTATGVSVTVTATAASLALRRLQPRLHLAARRFDGLSGRRGASERRFRSS